MPTTIAWTDETLNVVTGCSHVSPGCAHCFAESLSHRFGWTVKPWGAQHAAENVRLHPERLNWPARWRKPRRIFVNSMSDLFHEQVPDEFIDQVFAMMCAAKRHTFQCLTKRPRRMLEYMRGAESRVRELTPSGLPRHWYYCTDWRWPLPNAWIGVSVEDQRRADERIPLLLQVPAAVRFLSCEPLLGPLELERWLIPLSGANLHWVIVGGESGPGYRPMDLDWARSIRDECEHFGVAFWFKQQAGPRPGSRPVLDGQVWQQWPECGHDER